MTNWLINLLTKQWIEILIDYNLPGGFATVAAVVAGAATTPFLPQVCPEAKVTTPVVLSYWPTPETLQVIVSDAAAFAEAVQTSLPYMGLTEFPKSLG